MAVVYDNYGRNRGFSSPWQSRYQGDKVLECCAHGWHRLGRSVLFQIDPTLIL